MVSYDVWYFYSGCRADANEAAIILLPCNITVFTLDFSGSGLSDGNYVSLGWNEVGWSLVTVWKCSPSSLLFFVLSLFPDCVSTICIYSSQHCFLSFESYD